LNDNETYTALRAHWSALMQSDRKHELTASHHLLYLVLLGKDWRKAFTPPTNRCKLENGAFEGWVLFRALGLIHSAVTPPQLLAPFDGIVTPQTLQRIRELLPLLSPYRCKPEDFAGEAFPFEAYDVPKTMLARAANKEPRRA
jgi:hypothetical protein